MINISKFRNIGFKAKFCFCLLDYDNDRHFWVFTMNFHLFIMIYTFFTLCIYIHICTIYFILYFCKILYIKVLSTKWIDCILIIYQNHLL